MLNNNEKVYIEDKYVNWKPGKIHYWQSIPTFMPDNPSSEKLTEDSKSKPALVLIHGYAASVEHWRQTFAGLKNRYRIYGLDLLGFGQSDKPSGAQVNYTAGLWARQIYDFLRYKNEEKVVLCGHSMGGMASLEFCRQHPEMVAGLILVDASGLPDQGKAEMQGRNSRQESTLVGELLYNMIKAPFLGEAMAAILTSNRNIAERSLRQAYHNPAKVTPPLVEQFIAPLRSPGARDSYLAVTRNFANYQLPLKPGDITAKTLIIWGEYDKTMPPATMLPRWQKIIPQAKTFVAENAGHCPQDERPDLVNPQIMRFMETLDASVPVQQSTTEAEN